MEKKDVIKTFRCTLTESEALQKKSSEKKLSESEYIRGLVFKTRKNEFPLEIQKLLEELKYLNLKIGNNINQVVRTCNSKKFVSKADYQTIVEEMIKLEDAYEKIYQQLLEKRKPEEGD